ncbi:hypothetical protein FRB90_009940, partial [Tulasnella sp. 427]
VSSLVHLWFRFCTAVMTNGRKLSCRLPSRCTKPLRCYSRNCLSRSSSIGLNCRQLRTRMWNPRQRDLRKLRSVTARARARKTRRQSNRRKRDN